MTAASTMPMSTAMIAMTRGEAGLPNISRPGASWPLAWASVAIRPLASMPLRSSKLDGR